MGGVGDRSTGRGLDRREGGLDQTNIHSEQVCTPTSIPATCTANGVHYATTRYTTRRLRRTAFLEINPDSYITAKLAEGFICTCILIVPKVGHTQVQMPPGGQTLIQCLNFQHLEYLSSEYVRLRTPAMERPTWTFGRNCLSSRLSSRRQPLPQILRSTASGQSTLASHPLTGSGVVLLPHARIEPTEYSTQ